MYVREFFREKKSQIKTYIGFAIGNGISKQQCVKLLMEETSNVIKNHARHEYGHMPHNQQ